MDNNKFKFVVFSGSKETMERIANKGAVALNPETMRHQKIDKKAKYEVQEHGFIWYLMSDLDLRNIAKNKNLIL